MIEDTSFVIDLLRGDDGAVSFLDIIEGESRPEKLSSITVLELYEGFERRGPADRGQRVLDVLDTKHVVPADESVMRKAGQLSGRLVGEGWQIDREDCIVAATALLQDEPVVTRNVEHFDRIDGLEVRTY